MAKINLKGALKTEKIGNFGGICREGGAKESGSFDALDMCNFRILPGGELEKREGFAPLFTLMGEPRAFWNGYLLGENKCFALVGSTVYSVDISKNTQSIIGNILSSQGKAEFFFYRGRLFLIDGTELYCFNGEEFLATTGYIPLYGKRWNGEYGQPINEHINFLSDKIRIHFHTTEYTSTFYVGLKCSELISFQINGRDGLEKAKLSDDGLKIEAVSGFTIAVGDVIACLRLSQEELSRSELTASTRAAVYGGVDDGRIILYGGEDPSKIFISKYVSQKELSDARDCFDDCSDVYFPVSDTFSVSYGRYPVTAVCRHYDRLLIFTERETWMADFTKDTDTPYIIPINSGVGCLSEDGAILGGNSPYTVSEGGIYRWTSKDDERNECNAVCISSQINNMLYPSFFDHAVAFYNRKRDEVWFADPDSDEQDVWIFLAHEEKWYRFSGIPVDRFFSLSGQVCMLYGRYIFGFSESYKVDTAIGGALKENIVAYYESNLTDFGYIERSKHLRRMLFKADCDSDAISITLVGDRGGQKVVEIDDKSMKDPKYSTYLDVKLDIGRFRRMNYRFSTEGSGRPRIKMLALSAYK